MKFVKFLKEKKLFLIITLIVVIVGIAFAFFAVRGGGFLAELPSNLSNVGFRSKNYQDKSLNSRFSPEVAVDKNANPLPTETSSDSGEFPESKIIKKANVSLTVEQSMFLKTFNELQSLSKTFGGYVKNSSYNEYKTKMNGSMDLMIPSDKLSDFLNSMNKFGKVSRMNVSSEDVSGQYVDLSSRLNVLTSQRDLLLSWLNKAKNIGEMIQIRSQLEQVETQIETTKGRMKYINFHSSYSEVYIDINQNENSPSILKTYLSNLMKRAGTGVIYSFGFLLILLAWLIPYLIIVFIIYLAWKRRKNE